ncbi:MAG: sulfatase-like hydrolase/transferase [Verrucomicrobiales bacterium]|nr:sulfatase-like hydrolase/transferase [Verrucomicrobiales bacterium]
MIFSKLAVYVCSLLVVSAFADEKPNIIVFLVDDMGVMDTSLPGSDESFYETPNLERLAARGMMFQNGYCAHPRCVESRFAIQTGRSPYRDAAQTGNTGKAMAPHPTIGEAFQKGGYATGFFGKWHLGKTPEEFPSGRGYDHNIGGCHAGAVASHFFPFHVDPRTGRTGKEGPILGLEKGEPGENVTDRLTRETESWIRERAGKTDKPFFAFLSHFAVHTPIQGKPEEIAHFEKKIPSLPPAKGEGGVIPVDGSSKSRRDHPTYASMVKTTDDSLGRILDLLDELKIADNTILLFTSDHGGLSNRGPQSKRELATSNLPYRAGKGHLYDGGLRVPFLVAWPEKIPAASQSDAWAVGTDIMPTLLDLAGLEQFPEHHVDGVSLAPALLDGKGMEEREHYLWHHPLPRPTQTGDQAMSVLRKKNFKLVKTYFPEVAYQLYDLDADPYEQHDIAAEKPERVERMAASLVRNLTKAGAPDLRQDWKNKAITKPVTDEALSFDSGKPKQNVLFIAVDDLKPALGCYGDPVAISPNIDALARSGVVFANAHCQWPVCGPSRASLMTSLRPEAVGVMDLKTDMRAKDPNVLTIPQYFKQQGYTTTGVGKIYDPRCVDNKQSNDSPSWSVPFAQIRHDRVAEPDGKDQAARAPDVPDSSLTDGQIAEQGIGLIKELAQKGDPFFLAVGFKKPHLAFVAPKKYWDLYDRKELKLAAHKGSIENGSGYCLHDSEELRSYGGIPKNGPIPEELQLECLHGYYACVSFIDALVGQLVGALDSLGLREDTAIVLWGDHGFHLSDHNMWGKHSPLEEATRSPLIFSAPGMKSGITTQAPAEFTDIFPTLCELANLPVPVGLHGRSLLPVWKGEVDHVREGALCLFARRGAFGYSYRTTRYRYIEWVNKFGKTVATDLFDYENDPGETQSLSENSELVAKFSASLRLEAEGCERLNRTEKHH